MEMWLPSDFCRNIFNARFSASSQISLQLLKCYLHCICIQNHFPDAPDFEVNIKDVWLVMAIPEVFPRD